ncbi:MAG: response regulator transcription factor [Caulobacteraceae bacterium]
MRILVIEDDPELSRRLRQGLEQAGFAVDCADNGLDGYDLGRSADYDAVVLDLGLPDMPGLTILKRWRAAGRDQPVLILTGRGAWTERVEGLNAGADDYMAKPFQVAEVAARLNALIRRTGGRASPVLRRGKIELNPAEGMVRVDGHPVELTAQELRVLIYLMSRPGRIVSQDELGDHIYAFDAQRASNTIQVYVGRLRRKVGHDVIRTIRGLGYRFE